MNYWKSMEALRLCCTSPDDYRPMRVRRRDTKTSVLFECLIGREEYRIRVFGALSGYPKEIEEANVRAQTYANIYNSH